MNKLKSILKKLTPENPLYVAILQTAFSVLAFIALISIMIADPAIFTLLLMLGIIFYVIYEFFKVRLRIAMRKADRKYRR